MQSNVAISKWINPRLPPPPLDREFPAAIKILIIVHRERRWSNARLCTNLLGYNTPTRTGVNLSPPPRFRPSSTFAHLSVYTEPVCNRVGGFILELIHRRTPRMFPCQPSSNQPNTYGITRMDGGISPRIDQSECFVEDRSGREKDSSRFVDAVAKNINWFEKLCLWRFCPPANLISDEGHLFIILQTSPLVAEYYVCGCLTNLKSVKNNKKNRVWIVYYEG